MKRTLVVVAFLSTLILQGCKQNQEIENVNGPKQLNISILLDLSDRISPSKHPAEPSHKDRDLAVINSILDYFKNDMAERGTFEANGRIQIFMEPAPAIPGINDLQRKLSVDCSKMDVKQKKEAFDAIENTFNSALTEIYNQTIANGKFTGSDIWRFFQNKASDFCVAQDTNYRNILIVLTDGYIYDQTTTQRVGNRVQNLTFNTIAKYREAQNPIESIDNDDFGLMVSQDVDLSNLEVIVLEVSPKNNSQNDERILIHCIDKWLKEMGVQNPKVYSTDLPANTERRIGLFLEK